MTARFEDRTVLVTGAGSGIGRATALRFAEEGAAVFCVDIDGDAADATARAAGALATGLRCDVADAEQVRGCVARATGVAGRLDVLCNVAGTGRAVPIEDLEPAEWDRTIAVNLTGTYLMCRAAIGALAAARGCIVNVASVAGLRGIAFSSAYSASKGGVVILSRALAAELSDRAVRVNCVCPGGVDTPMVERFRLPAGAVPPVASRRGMGERRLAPPADIAAAIAYLASDDAASVSGATLVVDATGGGG